MGHQLDAARQFEGGQVQAETGQQGVGVGRDAGTQLHHGVQVLTHAIVGNTEAHRVDHVVVGDQGRLDLGRVDVHAPGDDEVAAAVGQEQVAVVVEVAEVADGEVALAPGR